MMTYYKKMCSQSNGMPMAATVSETEQATPEPPPGDEFGPWIWANGNGFFNDHSCYSDKSNYTRTNEIKMNPVPKTTASVSKELIKLHIDVDDIVSFNGFGPWMKPAGFEPPREPSEKPKKKKRKEPITLPIAKDKKEPIETKTDENDVRKPNITDILALSSHKTHSTPVDPVELKKRLVDLLVQRQTRGEQQALKLKKVNVKPIQVSNLETSVFNGWQKNGRSSDTKRTLADVTRNDKADNEETLVNPIAALHHQHHPGVHFRQQHSQNPLENIELEKGLKLPPVTQMATYNGKPCIVHKWPSSAQPHVRTIRENVRRNHSDSAVLNKSVKKRIQGSSVHDIIRGDLLKVNEGRNKRSRKLGDLSRNTRTECVKSRVGVYKS